MNKFKQILTIAGLALLFPIAAFGAVATWNSVTSPIKYVQPDKVTGTNPPVKADYFIATSGPSFFEGSLLVNTAAAGNESTEIDNSILLGYDTAGSPQWFIVNQDGTASFAGGGATIGATGIITANGSGLTNLNAGNISTGILGAQRGGTGFGAYTTGDLLYASGPTSLTTLAAAASGNALISNGAAAGPSWGKIGLTTAVSGTLPIGNGGTGATTFGANRIPYMNSGNTAFTSDPNLIYDGTHLVVGTTASAATQRLYIKDNGAVGTYTASIHTDDESPWALGIFNDTYSSTNPVLEYFGYNNGRFVMGTHDSQPFGIYTGGLPSPGGERLVISGSTGGTFLTAISGNVDLTTNHVFLSTNDTSPKFSFNSNGSTYYTNIFQGGDGTNGTLNLGRATSNLPAAVSTSILTVSDNMRVGIASSTPSATFGIKATNSTDSLFVVASTTNAKLMEVDNKGHVYKGGATGSVSACGTSPAIISANDNVGRILVGSVVATACTYTFATTWDSPPVCDANVEGGLTIAISASTTVSAVVFTGASAFTSDTLTFQCTGIR